MNPDLDPSSDPSSDPGSNPGSDPGSDPGFILSLSLFIKGKKKQLATVSLKLWFKK